MTTSGGSAGVVLLLLAGCAGAAPPARDASSLPDSVGGLARVRSVAGEEAQNLIGLLHPGPLAPAESEVGFYAADSNRAVLYVSRFASPDTAREQVLLMSTMIGQGRGGFGHYSETEIGGTVVHAARSRGRPHFFFRRDRDVVWLAADPAQAQLALAELLHVSADSIPLVGSTPGR